MATLERLLENWDGSYLNGMTDVEREGLRAELAELRRVKAEHDGMILVLNALNGAWYGHERQQAEPSERPCGRD